MVKSRLPPPLHTHTKYLCKRAQQLFSFGSRSIHNNHTLVNTFPSIAKQIWVQYVHCALHSPVAWLCAARWTVHQCMQSRMQWHNPMPFLSFTSHIRFFIPLRKYRNWKVRSKNWIFIEIGTTVWPVYDAKWVHFKILTHALWWYSGKAQPHPCSLFKATSRPFKRGTFQGCIRIQKIGGAHLYQALFLCWKFGGGRAQGRGKGALTYCCIFLLMSE